MTKIPSQSFKECYGTWALVAGAAEGLGESFTEALAKKGMNLVMVDLNATVLHKLAERIKINYNVMIREISLDLSENDAWMKCMKAIHDLDCRMLIYIPAYSRVQEFLSNSPGELDKYIDLNSRTPIHLVHCFISSLKDREPAGIILMSSLAGLIGPPYLAPYAATKAFNVLLAESLHSEMREKNIDISVCCAGQTSTPAYWSSNPAEGSKWPPVMSSDKIADYALKNLGKKTLLIPGWQNRISYFLLTRILSRTFAGKIVNKAMRKTYPKVDSSHSLS
jgi:uncharacterized protein